MDILSLNFCKQSNSPRDVIPECKNGQATLYNSVSNFLICGCNLFWDDLVAVDVLDVEVVLVLFSVDVSFVRILFLTNCWNSLMMRKIVSSVTLVSEKRDEEGM